MFQFPKDQSIVKNGYFFNVRQASGGNVFIFVQQHVLAEKKSSELALAKDA